MRRVRFLLVVALLTGCGGAAPPEGPKTYTSYFGFTVQLSGGWLPLSPSQIASANAEESLRSLGIDTKWDQGNLSSILERVKTGEVEFYFDRQTVGSEFQNNISAQLMPGRGLLTEDLVSQMCKDIPAQLPALFGGAPVELRGCGLRRANDIAYVSYEYSVPAHSYHVLQDELPFVNDSTLVVVGGTLDSGALPRINEAQRAIVSGATKFAAERRTSGSSGPPSLRSDDR
jgi:hypothetical protein